MKFLRCFLYVLSSFSLLPFMGSSEGFVVVHHSQFATARHCKTHFPRCPGVQFGHRLDPALRRLGSFGVQAQLWNEEEQNQEKEGVLSPSPHWEPTVYLESALIGLGEVFVHMFALVENVSNNKDSRFDKNSRFDAVSRKADLCVCSLSSSIHYPRQRMRVCCRHLHKYVCIRVDLRVRVSE
jgi:hypothetical protein